MASDLLSIGLSGAKAARIGLDVTAQNIANAGNDGYVRRSIGLTEVASTGYNQNVRDISLSGVRVDKIVRNADAFRQAEVRRTGAEAARGKKVAMLGLTFKPNTDDMREAPSRVVIKSLLQHGAKVTAYDPVAGHEAMAALKIDFEGQEALLKNFTLVAQDMDALKGVDALLILTEWKNFHNPDFQAMKLSMRTPYILDGRNLYNPDALADLGIAYQGIGRRNELINLAVDPISENVLSLDA